MHFPTVFLDSPSDPFINVIVYSHLTHYIYQNIRNMLKSSSKPPTNMFLGNLLEMRAYLCKKVKRVWQHISILQCEHSCQMLNKFSQIHRTGCEFHSGRAQEQVLQVRVQRAYLWEVGWVI